MRLGDLTAAAAKGLFAGVAGTAATTVSSTLQIKVRGRQASSAPAKAASKVLGIEPKGDEEEAKFSNLVHWGYGTGWAPYGSSSARPALKVPGPRWRTSELCRDTEQIISPALEVALTFWQWEAKDKAIDSFHHLVCASATSIAYAIPDR